MRGPWFRGTLDKITIIYATVCIGWSVQVPEVYSNEANPVSNRITV